MFRINEAAKSKGTCHLLDKSWVIDLQKAREVWVIDDKQDPQQKQRAVTTAERPSDLQQLKRNFPGPGPYCSRDVDSARSDGQQRRLAALRCARGKVLHAHGIHVQHGEHRGRAFEQRSDAQGKR
jgi:hypothetical protein